MTQEDTHSEIIEILAIHEELIGQLYKIYAEKFPNYREFWSTISEEEFEHAGWIRKLGEKLKNRTAVCHIEKFRTSVVQASVDVLKDELSKAQRTEISLADAFTRAIDLEKAILDGKIFQAFEAFSLDAKSILRDLTDAVSSHVARIEKIKAGYSSS